MNPLVKKTIEEKGITQKAQEVAKSDITATVFIKDLASIIQMMDASIINAVIVKDLKTVATAAAHWRLLIAKAKKQVKELVAEPKREIKKLETPFKEITQKIKEKFAQIYQQNPVKEKGIFTYQEPQETIEIAYEQISYESHPQLYKQECQWVLDADKLAKAPIDTIPQKKVLQEGKVGIQWKQLEKAAQKLNKSNEHTLDDEHVLDDVDVHLKKNNHDKKR